LVEKGEITPSCLLRWEHGLGLPLLLLLLAEAGLHGLLLAWKACSLGGKVGGVHVLLRGAGKRELLKRGIVEVWLLPLVRLHLVEDTRGAENTGVRGRR